jgi:hypothetical protein
MDVSEVRRRLKVALDAGKRGSAERRIRNDEAARQYETFLVDKAVPLFQQMAGALTAEGHPFKVMTPSGSVRLSPDGSSDEFIELMLDASLDPPEAVVRVVRGRGRRRVETELPVREGTSIEGLSDEHVLDMLLREVVALVQR